ncbi:MAG: hypothetical protein VB009_00580 [Erysipelotrichaceae bacterium]|nr:hypothetical protein [Erysipelotrichaceae bacterium]
MRKRIKVITIMMLVVMFFISGCIANTDKTSIYYDDSKIAKQGDSYSYIKVVRLVVNSSVEIKFNSFTGKNSIYKIEAAETDTISLYVKVKQESGNLKICLVDSNANVITLWENASDETLTFTVNAGENTIIMVGDDAKAEIAYSFIDKGNSAKINVID